MHFDQAGRLDQRITLQTAIVTRDALGGPVESWEDGDRVWARVRTLTGKQIQRAQQASADVSKAINIRWRADVTSAMRVKFANGGTARVSWIEDDRRAGWLTLVVEDLNG